MNLYKIDHNRKVGGKKLNEDMCTNVNTYKA